MAQDYGDFEEVEQPGAATANKNTPDNAQGYAPARARMSHFNNKLFIPQN